MAELNWKPTGPLPLRLWRGQVSLSLVVALALATQITAVWLMRSNGANAQYALFVDLALALPVFIVWRAVKNPDRLGSAAQSLWLVTVFGYASAVMLLQAPPTWIAQLTNLLPKAAV